MEIGSLGVATAAAAAGLSMPSGERLETTEASSSADDDWVADTSPFSVGTELLPSADSGDSTIGSSFFDSSSGTVAASCCWMMTEEEEERSEEEEKVVEAGTGSGWSGTSSGNEPTPSVVPIGDLVSSAAGTDDGKSSVVVFVVVGDDPCSSAGGGGGGGWTAVSKGEVAVTTSSG